MGFLLENLARLIVSPFVDAWRRLRSSANPPVGLQRSLAADMRSLSLISDSAFDAQYDQLAQRVMRDLRFRPSVSRLKALEVVFCSLDDIDARESSEQAVEAVVDRLVWRVNTGNLH